MSSDERNSLQIIPQRAHIRIKTKDISLENDALPSEEAGCFSGVSLLRLLILPACQSVDPADAHAVPVFSKAGVVK